MSVGSAEPAHSVGVDPWTSHGFTGQVEEDDDDTTVPSLIPGNETHGPLWVCASCGSPDWRRMGDGYRCSTCGGVQFIDHNNRWNDGLAGSWIFVPSQATPPRTPSTNAPGTPSQMSAAGTPDGDDYDEPNHDRMAESETATDDPSVDTMTLAPRMSRRQRRRAKRTAQGAQPSHGALGDPQAVRGSIVCPDGKAVPSPKVAPAHKDHPSSQVYHNSGSQHDPKVYGHDHHQLGPSEHHGGQDQNGDPWSQPMRRPSETWRDDMLKNLSNAVTKDKYSDWSLEKGPSPGVKYRSGQPPPPPQWHYQNSDLRAFQKWKRRLDVWRLQVSRYLPPREAALQLYVSLKGEMEEELEWVDLRKIDCDTGIDFIIQQLEKPLKTREVYVKRQYLWDFENLQRSQNESVRSFCNRYYRCERSLAAVGVNINAVYDDESRGARLLDRLRLSLEQQRMILVGTNQSLNFDHVKEAAILQFPEHRPAPFVVYHKEFDRNKTDTGKNDRNDQQRPQHGKGGKGSSGKSNAKDKGKGNSGPSFTKSTYLTEIPENEATENDGEEDEKDNQSEAFEDQEEDEDQETPEDDVDPDQADVDLAAHCLTVTARRLAGLKLGRKFSGQGNKSIAQRKADSHCSACGVKGHWKGDPECQYSTNSTSSDSKGNKKGKTSTGPQDGDASKSKIKKVMTVTHSSGSQQQVDPSITNTKTFGTYFTFMVINPNYEIHQIFATSVINFNHYLVLDTACQRTCCSRSWFTSWQAYVADQRFQAKLSECCEPFEFGHGPTQYSTQHAYLPVSFSDESETTFSLLGTCIIETANDIPLLGSNVLLGKKMQATLDLPRQEAYLAAFACSVPIVMINGHLAVDIARFPQHASRSFTWQQFAQLSDEHDADPEFIAANMLKARTLTSTTLEDAERNGPHPCATTMAPALASLHGSTLPGASARQGDDTGSSPANSLKDVAASTGPNGPERERDAVQESHQRMPARDNPEKRQQTRQVLQVPGVRQEMGVGRVKPNMDRAKSVKSAAAAALTVLVYSNHMAGQGLHPSSVHGHPDFDSAVEVPRCTTFSCQELHTGDDPRSQAGPWSQSQVREEKQPRSGGGFGGRLGPGGRSQVRLSKTGNTIWLTGHLRACQKLYDREVQAYEALATHYDYKKAGAEVDLLDLVEVFAGKATVTALAPAFGLSAIQPFDKIYGQDLLDPEAVKTLHIAISRYKPLLTLIAWPCTEWSRPLVDLGCDIAEGQMEEDRLFLAENPIRSRIWKEPRVEELRQRPDVFTVENEAGAFGAETSDGQPIQKGHRWITNSPELAELLSFKMTAEQKMYTTPVQGKHTKASGEYCLGLACAILEGLQREARKRNPQRFQQTNKNEVYYLFPSLMASEWEPILDEAERRFQNTYKKPFTLAEKDDMYKQIEQLVPWNLARIQVAWTPQARRWPDDIPFTHRGCAYRSNQGEFSIEHEDMTSVNFPKQRFAHPVRIAIFFYGNAPEDGDHDMTDLRQGEEQSTERVPGINTDIYFEGGPAMTREMRTSIARLHCNLGHAPKAEIVRILAAAGKLDNKILGALDALRCGTCKRLSKPIKPPTSSTAAATRYAGAFGEHLQADIIFIRLLDGSACPVLGMTCTSTNYHTAKALENRTPDHVLQTLHEIWYRPLGLPISIQLDADTAFLGVTQEWHNNLGIEYDIIPTEEAWKLGKIGRRNALMRTLAEKLIDQNGVIDKKHLNEILVAVLHSMNNSTYSYGRSPCQAVFGRLPRPVGDILSDDKSLAISTQPHPEQHALRPELLRAEALSALAQFSASQAVRRALLRKTRHQNDPSHLEPGQAVAFWRQSAKARQHKRGAWCLGRFLAIDPDKKHAWIQVGKNSLKVGTTQLREATGWESWTPTKEDLKMLKQAENTIAAGLWQDETGPAPDEDDTTQMEEDIFRLSMPRATTTTLPTPEQQQHHEAIADDEEAETPQLPPPYNMATVPQNLPSQPGPTESNAMQPPYSLPFAQVQPPTQHISPLLPLTARNQRQEASATHEYHQSTQHIQQQNQYHQQNLQLVNIHSPTYQNFGPRTEFGSNPPTPRGMRRRSRTPSNRLRRQLRPASPDSTMAPADDQSQPPDATMNEQQHQTQPEDTTTKIQPQQYHTYYNNYCFEYFDNGEVGLRPPGFDGSHDNHSTNKPSKQAYTAYLNSNYRKVEMKNVGITHNANQADHSDSDSDLKISNQRTMTRQELKQLDRELPWREIVAMPKMIRDKFVEAAINEYNGWIEWSSIRPLTQKEAKQVYNDPKLRRRILKSRAAYRDKSRGVGEIRAKARVVLIGCCDPDLERLTRDSPTPTRLSECILMSVAASGANGDFNNDGRIWRLWVSDAEKAFLQGDQDTTERSGQPLYMLPPKDPIIIEANVYTAPLYLITSNAYGLPNAPRVWYNKVHKTVTMHNFKQHSFDRCLYYHLGEDNLLDCLLIIHVDDVLATYSETFQVNILANMFQWGSVTHVSLETPGEYRGKEITMFEKDGKKWYRVTQKAFISKLTPGSLPTGRLQKPLKLTDEERKEFRSVCGCLQWLAGQCRPELCAPTSLSHKGADTDVHDLKVLYECLDFTKKTPDSGIVYPAVPLNRASTLIAYSDASWSNASNFKSQFGALVMICPAQVSEKTSYGFLVDWKSGRTQRVCRSTLASEACARDEAADRCCFTNLVLTELLYGEPAFRGEMRMNSFLCTDAKSLYDCLVSENPALADRRSMVQVRSVQQNFPPERIRWVPTRLQFSDGLTKADQKLREAMRNWCQHPWAQIKDDSSKTKTSVNFVSMRSLDECN